MKSNMLFFIGIFLTCTNKADEFHDAFHLLNQSFMTLDQHLSITPLKSSIPVAPPLSSLLPQPQAASERQDLRSALQSKLTTLKKTGHAATLPGMLEEEVKQLDQQKKDFIQSISKRVMFGTPEEIAKIIKELRSNRLLRDIDFDEKLNREVTRRLSVIQGEEDEQSEEFGPVTTRKKLSRTEIISAIKKQFEQNLARIPDESQRTLAIQQIATLMEDNPDLNITVPSERDRMFATYIQNKIPRQSITHVFANMAEKLKQFTQKNTRSDDTWED